jgi:hypothetical protein
MLGESADTRQVSIQSLCNKIQGVRNGQHRRGFEVLAFDAGRQRVHGVIGVRLELPLTAMELRKLTFKL